MAELPNRHKLHKLQKPTRRWPTGVKPACLSCKMAFDTFRQLRRHRPECPVTNQPQEQTDE